MNERLDAAHRLADVGVPDADHLPADGACVLPRCGHQKQPVGEVVENDRIAPEAVALGVGQPDPRVSIADRGHDAGELDDDLVILEPGDPPLELVDLALEILA